MSDFFVPTHDNKLKTAVAEFLVASDERRAALNAVIIERIDASIAQRIADGASGLHSPEWEIRKQALVAALSRQKQIVIERHPQRGCTLLIRYS